MVKNKRTASSSFSVITALSLFLSAMIVAADTGATFYCDGIGYREAALQNPKTSFFRSEEPNGISYASFNGGTNIFIKCPELHDNPQSNDIFLRSVELNTTVQAPPLTEDDAFQSQPLLGHITYRLPSVHELFGAKQEVFDTFETMTFYLTVKAPGLEVVNDLVCSSENKCRIIYKKSFTPRIFYLTPPVVYYESYTEVYYNPKQMTSVIQNLESDEMPFVNLEIAGSKLDFEFSVDYETSQGYWWDKSARGQVGELPVGRNDSIKFLWETGYAGEAEQEITHCSFDNQTCYKVLNVPVIFNMSSHTGFSSGGQNLTIHGHGFNHENISITVDGVDCPVSFYKESSVSCEVQSKSSPSVSNVPQIGSHGLRDRFINESYWLSFSTIESDGYNYTERLKTQFEVETNFENKIGHKMLGWFIPPTTGRYRFYQTCDDQCRFSMGLNTSDPLTKTQLTYRGWATNRRQFFRQYYDAKSDWVNLTQGEKYYVEASHREGSGADHMAVAVEIEQSNTTGHHHAMKEVQYVSISNPNSVYEASRITISNVENEGNYKINIQNPKDMSYFKSVSIPANATTTQVKDAVKKFYSDNYGSDITVNKTMYLADGTNTTNQTAAVKHVFYINLRKLITGTTTSQVLVSKNTTATVTFEAPSLVQQSTAPMSGSFRIRCPTVDNSAYSESIDIPYNYHPLWVKHRMELGCKGLYEKIEVWWDHLSFTYYENGLAYYIRYVGKNEPVGLAYIVSGTDTPLGNADDLVAKSNVTIPYGENLFFEPIPFDMLRTYETEPQVLVKVGEHPAVCHNLTCNFGYTIPVGEVTDYSYDTSSKTLILNGTDLPLNTSEIRYIEFAHSKCSISSISNTTTENKTDIICVLDNDPTCGTHYPQLVNKQGKVNNSAALNATVIGCTATAVVPTTQLNHLGGDNLTLTGTNFPWELQRSNVTINFNDTYSTRCVPQTSTSTSMVCLTDDFNTTGVGSHNLLMNITINGQTVSQSLGLALMPTTETTISMNPDSANPTLKTKINITLESTFPHTLVKSDFSVNATNITNPSYMRQMNVIAVDDSTKTLTCMFGGAWSGLYQISIRHREYGRVNTTGLILTVGSNVTSISPSAGSIYGGTEVTITGTNFGTVFTDNPVQISTLGGVGSAYCYLHFINSTTIKCRVGPTNQPANQVGKLVTFLKTSEEAKCVPDSACTWTYTSSIPTVTSMSAYFNTTHNYWAVRVDGSNMYTGSGVSSTFLEVDGVMQETLQAYSSHAIFKITNITENVLKNMNLYFSVGFPEGHKTVIQGQTIELTPKLVNVAVTEGSVGGTIIKSNIQGFGPFRGKNATYMAANGITLVDNSTGADICDEVKVEDYGVVYCKTKKQEIANTVLGVKSIKNNSAEPCVGGANDSHCHYNQTNNGSFPNVTSISNTATQIVFTGTNFFTTDFTAHASYSGLAADTVVVDSATQVTATWNMGIPPMGTDIVPQLWFNSTSGDIVHMASITAVLNKTLDVTSSTSGMTCSFAGGCILELQAAGLSGLLKNDSASNRVTVCDETCEFQEWNSTSATTRCRLPPMSTVYSNTNFKIETESEDLRPRSIFGNINDVKLAFDSKMAVQTSNSQSTCSIGAGFKPDHVGMLSQVKYFMTDIDNLSLYNGILKFQGSSDNATWVDLHVADENIHEGWNYVDLNETGTMPKYRFYRIYSSTQTGCLVNEIKFTGVETVDNNDATYSCNVQVKLGNGASVTNVTNNVTFANTDTTLLTSISPRYGTVVGGTSVTFTGTNFVTDTSLYNITIDGINCPVSAATTTSVTCTTGSRPGLIPTSLDLSISGNRVATQGLLYRYVSVWSSDTTWGGEFAPMEMESVYIPTGLNLLVDVDSTPQLNLVMVEGALIFAPESDATHKRTFDARYIFLNQGYMEVGTEEFPYTSQLTITMHGNITSPYLPVYGNKCIAVKESILDMHGVARTPTWTVLNETVQPGATTIKLSEAVDWVAGEEIAIAATSYNGREGEQRRIVSIDNTNVNNPVITLDQPLEFKHFAMIQWYGDDFIDMRAEVGLLTRNIKYQGSPYDSANDQYGAVFFLHSQGDDSLVARLDHIELYNVGQAFKVGRYAVHFHMIGAVHKSYCKGLGTHQSFNRAFTIHGTYYLRLMNNVAFDVKGHVIFIEDAVEKKNYMYKNLIMMAKRSWSLLNTDQTPACFWITNPDNNFVENHCGGSDRYAYWYDLQKHAIGPHANTNVCPENERVGTFRDNHAHSCGRYGLRIFHNMEPRKYPCKGVTYDPNNATDPYWQNPAITAEFWNLTSWKNGRNGAIAERVGDVRFHNFKVADNILAGIEFSLTDMHGDNTTRVDNALIIGKTNNTDEILDHASPFGFIGPRTENFRIQNSRFFNFNWNKAAALSSCSHCFHPAATDSGARTVRASNLTFDSTVTRTFNFQYPWKSIYLDEDGSITGKGAGSWATPYYPHHNQTECEHKPDEWGAVFCDNTVQIRRVAFWNWKPDGLLSGMALKILRYDDSQIGEYTNLADYHANKTDHSTIHFKEKSDPGNGWATPFVTGHKYKVHWGMTGLDFEQMQYTLSERWEPTDKGIYFVHNFTDVRAEINFTVQMDGETMWRRENNTIPSSNINDGSDFQLGQNLVLNDTHNGTALKMLHFIATGKNQSNSTAAEQHVKMVGNRCPAGVCPVEKIIVPGAYEDRVRYWDVPSDWPNGTVPAEGEDVHIEPAWNMVFNMNPSPKYKLIRVNGNLTFAPNVTTHLRAKHIFIRAGELNIGTKEFPNNQSARITLYGEKNAEAIVYDNAIEAGNKLIANVGKIRMFGLSRTKTLMRLLKPAERGSNEIWVDPNLDLVAGDRLALMPTSYSPRAIDDTFVQSYDNTTGKVILTSNLNYYHWGQATSTGTDFDGVDMRGEVLLLTRNVKIDAEDIESWGGQLVTSDTIEPDGTMRQGHTILDNVEIFNCSQIDTFKAAIRFEAASGKWSSVTNSAIHNGYAWGLNVKTSQNILIQNNTFWGFRPIGVGIMSSKNITFDNNVVGHVVDRTTVEALDQFVDKAGAISVCAYFEPDTSCANIHITNNLAAASVYSGFVGAIAHTCGDTTSTRFRDNVAHSVIGIKSGSGAYINKFEGDSAQEDCFEVSNFKAYKTYHTPFVSVGKTKKIVMSRMTFIDNREGYTAVIVKKEAEYGELLIESNDIKIYGESDSPDCPNNGGFCHLYHKSGLVNPVGLWKGKDMHIAMLSPLPPHKVKSISAWGTKVVFNRLEFINWNATTKNGMKNSIFAIQEWASDYVPMMEFHDTKFINCHADAMAYIYDPPQKWAIIKDCGEWPCTAPQNALLSFKNTQFTGITPSYAASDFQVISDNDGFSPHVPGCVKHEGMNAWTCQQSKLSILQFESEDPDTLDRSMQPIYSKMQGTNMNNKINSYMDHVWDGFYTGQTRLSRFPILVYAKEGSVYDLQFTGTPAKKMRFTLRSQDADAKMTIRIKYPSAQSRGVTKDGELVNMNQWNETLRGYGPIMQTTCGENRYIGVSNILEFYLTAGCELHIQPRDAIQTMVRMEWTMDEFFDNGGTTTFVDRVAGSLGIHASTIKVVGVYTGSVVVDYEIEPDKSAGQTASDLKAIKEKQTQQFATGNMSLGAPLLDVKVKTSVNTTATPSTSSTTNSTSSSGSSSSTEQEEETSIITGGVVDQSTGYEPIILTRTSASGLIKFHNYFESAFDMRSGEAKECVSSSNECGGYQPSSPGSTMMNMCCSDVFVTDNEDGSKQNVKRCMNRETVNYNYGITIDGGYKIDMVCLSYAKYLTLTFAAAVTSVLAFAF